MRSQRNPVTAADAISLDEIFARTPANPAVLVADGYGITVRVDRGRLTILDGIGQTRRTRTLSRAHRTVKRIVALGHTGSITLDAFRWCTDTGIALLVVDTDGAEMLNYASPARYDDARLRRAQAQATTTDTGLDIARRLVAAKLAGQARVAATRLRRPDIDDEITASIAALDDITDPARCLLVEARAASAYFGAWTGLELRFATAEQQRVPDSWRGYGQRASELVGWGSPRSATHPINAMLNYCYRLAEVEATLACHALGLDPGLGVLHVDKAYRGSLALDLIEPIRPDIDAYVLDLVADHTFRRGDFHETREGRCRVLAPLTHTLAECMPQWAQALAPHAEAVAHAIVEMTAGARRRAPLTGKPRNSPRRTVRQPPPARPTPPCPECGRSLGDRRRSTCPECFAKQRLTLARDRAAAAEARLTLLRQLATDPATRPEPNILRSAKASANRTANDLWDLEHVGATRDQSHYRTRILPGLAAVPVQQIAERLQIAGDAAWRIREGRLTPHPRHWVVLADLSASRTPEPPPA